MNRIPRLWPPSLALRDRRFWIDNAHALLVLATYLLLLFSRLLDTAWLSRDNEYLGVVLLQVLIFLVPGLIYCKLRGTAFTNSLRLRLPRLSHTLLLVSALCTLMTGGLLISVYSGGIGTLDEGFTLYDTFSAKGGNTAGEVIYLILAYAALPAICEEFVYRGVLCVTLEERGLLPTVLYSSLAFGMLHFEITHLPVYVFAGALFCAVLYCTRSLASTVLVHFLYNIFGLFGQPAISRFYVYTGSTKLFSFLLTFAFLLSAVVFCGEASRIYRGYSRTGMTAPYRVDLPRDELTARVLHTLFPPAGIACVAVYLLACLFIA